MAGKGQRFRSQGYEIDKPLIPIKNKPMIKVVLNNLYTDLVSHVVLVAQRSLVESNSLFEICNTSERRLTILSVDALTGGPAETLEFARVALDDNLPLVVANSDQYINFDVNRFYSELVFGENHGLVMTMTDYDPKWSYAEVNNELIIQKIVEKKVISDYATVGIYGFKQASFAWEAIKLMKLNNDKTNSEYYVAPSYNYFKYLNLSAKIFHIGKINDAMYGLGIPEDLELFLTHNISNNI